jgi:predicted small metal-binding protein
MKEFECGKVLPESGCDFKATGSDEKEILDKAAVHGREKHGITEMTDEIKEKVRSVIRDKKEAA